MVSYDVTGTASGGSDYTALSGTVVVGASGTANIAVAVTDDMVDDDAETIVLTLTSRSVYAIGTKNAATVTITDDDAAPSGVTLSVSPSSVGEDDGATQVTVTAAVDGSTRFGTAKTVAVTVAGHDTAGQVQFAQVSTFNINIGRRPCRGRICSR